jgi:hypothetical protein
LSAGLPRPDQATYDALADDLESGVDRAAATNPNPGRTETFHRLNRAEYANAIRDLLALEVDAASLLPPDEADNNRGFDNIANALSVSPALVERYMSANRKLSRLAVGLPPRSASFETYKVSPLKAQDDQASEELPFGSVGGLAIRRYFPVDGEYSVKITLQKTYVDYVRGIGEPHVLEVRLDGRLLQRFTVGSKDKGRPAPASYAGNWKGEEQWENYARTADTGLEVRFHAKAGPRIVGVSFVGKPHEPDGVLQPHPANFINLSANYDEMPDGNPGVESVVVGGPYSASGPVDTPSRRRIFVCRPINVAGEDLCARKILTALARRAYRRSVTEEDLRTLMGFYRAGRHDGGFDAGIQFALERILDDPGFLFRAEYDPPKIAAGTAYYLSDLELASRLSFFLWSSIPDDELLDLAERGKLHDPSVLERQVRRMAADDRSKALVYNFAGQWLHLRGLRAAAPDPDLFPDFDENLREAFQQETELFFESNLREDRSVLDLFSADYTFLNERLAKFYGIPDVYGSFFRRVSLSGHEERRGLLGQGSILTATSYPNRTSPVLRGKWVLENILGTPPPPPPPNVPGLKDKGENGKVVSVRERLEQHRSNPVCASCHARMDPLGFALENFNAIGEWRTTGEAHTPIDASGVLQDGTKFDGPVELRRVLSKHPEQFASTVAEKLLTYALGREVEYYDQPAIRKITREAAPSGYCWSSLILGVVKSVPFRMRMKSTPDSGKAKTMISQIPVEH